MYKVKKVLLDGIELLPDITDTSIWKDFDEISCNKNINLVATLYKAVTLRENYFQLNTPNAFGDSQYSYYCGCVNGILQEAEIEEIIEDYQIFLREIIKYY